MPSEVAQFFETLAQSRISELLFLVLVLGTARPLAFVMVTPIFTRFGLQQGLIRSTILLAFAMPVLPGLYIDLAGAPTPNTAEIALLVAKEIVIGLILSLVLGIPLWAVAAAGDIIDMQRGAIMSEMVDPGSGDATTPTGTLFFLMAALLLVSNGWFTEVLLASLYGTYEVWPVLAPLPSFEPDAAWRALDILQRLAETSLTLAMPIVGAILLAEFTLALALKYTQQINAMILAMSVKQIIFIMLLPVYFASMMYFVSGHVKDLGGLINDMQGFFSPDGVSPQ